MGNHFVPQLYLQSFTQDGKLWAYDKKDEKIFLTQPKSVANEKGMYPEELEYYFTERIEQPAQHAIEQIRVKGSLSEDDKNALAHYLVALWKRGPAGRSRSADRLPGIGSSVERDIHKQIDDLCRDEPELVPLAEQKKALVSEIIRRNVGERSKEIWQQVLSSEATPRIVEAVVTMNWQFLFTDHGEYVTSDNPLFFFSHEGIGPECAEITMPFTSSIALWMNRDPKPKSLYAQASKEFVKEINRRTAYNATRFVFSSTNEPWKARLIFKHDYRLNRIAW